MQVEALLAIPIGIVVGGATSVITVWLSLSRFRAEKWWELRVRAYERVIEALHEAKAYASARVDEQIEGARFSDEVHKKLAAAPLKQDMRSSGPPILEDFCLIGELLND